MVSVQGRAVDAEPPGSRAWSSDGGPEGSNVGARSSAVTDDAVGHAPGQSGTRPRTAPQRNRRTREQPACDHGRSHGVRRESLRLVAKPLRYSVSSWRKGILGVLSLSAAAALAIRP